MTTQYGVHLGTNTIRKYEISRETEHNIWYAATSTRGERKIHKNSSHVKFFPSWHEAYTYLVDKKQTQVRMARRRLDCSIMELDEVLLMKEE